MNKINARAGKTNNYNRVIVVDIGGTKSKAAEIVNGKIISVIEEKTPAHLAKKDFEYFLLNFIENIFSKRVGCICIGVPALVEKGIAFESPNIKALRNFNVKKIVSKKFKKQVFVSNDAKCFTLGEKYFGNVYKSKNVVCITLGTGIGSGAIINNQVYFGNVCGASEIGRIPYKESELEDYCSLKFFERNGLPREKLFNSKFKKQHKKVYSEFGKHLGVAISIIINIFAPEKIILGGGISNDFDLFKKEMFAEAKKYSYKKSMSSVKIIVSKNKYSALLGASKLPLEGCE
jgi:glucokinase